MKKEIKNTKELLDNPVGLDKLTMDEALIFRQILKNQVAIMKKLKGKKVPNQGKLYSDIKSFVKAWNDKYAGEDLNPFPPDGMG